MREAPLVLSSEQRGQEAHAAFDRAIALAGTPAEAAHIRLHLDRLIRENAEKTG